jgi:carboxymethylenebutenolidase
MCTLEGCGTKNDMPPIIVADGDRRAFLAGLASLPIAAVLADPALAQSAAARVAMVEIATPRGKPLSAAVALPAAPKGPAVILVHEWWGLNDQIKAVAAELAKEGHLAIAVDLFGKVAANAEEAKAQVQGLDPEWATQAMVAAAAWARGHERSTGKLATIGWCFGGGWSLNTALATPTDGCVIYYGRVNKSAEELAPLACPVLGHFATLDQNINKPMVDGFLAAAKAAGKDVTVYWYEADHAFANPTGARYDQADAALAWERTTAYLKDRLG